MRGGFALAPPPGNRRNRAYLSGMWCRDHPGFVALLTLVALLLPARAFGESAEIVVFTREGCPRCVEAATYLQGLATGGDAAVTVTVRRVDVEPGAGADLAALAEARGIHPVGVPAFLVDGTLVVGWQGPVTAARLDALLAGASLPAAPAPAATDLCLPEQPCGPAETVDLPAFGAVDAGTLGLPLFTLAVGLVDGFNPCAMWVLLFVLSLLAAQRDRRRMALIGGTFVFVSGAVYFVFMAAWLEAFLWVGLSRTLQIGLGFVALGAASIHIKDFFAFHRGPTLSIPESAKPGIYARARRIIQARSHLLALGGAAALAVVVNLVELLCTAGLPALYTQILASRQLSTGAYYGYLALYDAAYMLGA
jgi:glutaredoxin